MYFSFSIRKPRQQQQQQQLGSGDIVVEKAWYVKKNNLDNKKKHNRDNFFVTRNSPTNFAQRRKNKKEIDERGFLDRAYETAAAIEEDV